MLSFGCGSEHSGLLAAVDQILAWVVPLFGLVMVSSCFMLAIGANNEQYHRFQRHAALVGSLGIVAAGAGYGFVQAMGCLEVGEATISGFLVVVLKGAAAPLGIVVGLLIVLFCLYMGFLWGESGLRRLVSTWRGR